MLRTALHQETWSSVTNRTTHLCKCNGVDDLLKHAPAHTCYHAKFGNSALKCVGINTGEPQNWGSLELRSLTMGGLPDPKIHTPPHMCYHIKCGTSGCDKGCTHK